MDKGGIMKTKAPQIDKEIEVAYYRIASGQMIDKEHRWLLQPN